MNILKRDIQDIFLAGVKAADPCQAMEKNIQLKGSHLTVADKTYDLSFYQKILIAGAGKASAAMALSLEKILEGRALEGVVIVKTGYRLPLQQIRVKEASHPIPDEAGVRATADMTSFLERSKKDALVIFLVSGGGSALLIRPIQGLTLQDMKKTTDVLLRSGASIQEMNAVRKHLSSVKGGRLARTLNPSPVISFVLSDVIGNDLSSIASGPLVPDPSTYHDCLNIIERYDLLPLIPPSVLNIINRGIGGEIEETPKKGDPVFNQIQNVIIADNQLALEGSEKKAVSLGYNTQILSSSVSEEARAIARIQALSAKKIQKENSPLKKPACILSGGETTVSVQGSGMGGRNQEFVLSAALELDGEKNIAVLSGGTDGTDGPTDAAGAYGDGATIQRAKDLGMKAETYLKENDSYHFFQKLDDLIITGPTNTNVMDLMLFLIA